eukprot:CAMPEP_0116997620 /NCGR_PEP_ID=MMETSP0472-20121206/992_1 /TAXON_ID=693140 ORGANISM="Tiarina fusus, Strain LIS" /NCGR_SAMPLE_ID=MMETSP0472 /ASSEMBLY_ACC=CAM_ASM_000603 /LENGTH=268 /DNA_ID=CAMNT_0004696555 /DNA_START=27 /DNA_END=833 /DNA_ORIENTATION=-
MTNENDSFFKSPSATDISIDSSLALTEDSDTIDLTPRQGSPSLSKFIGCFRQRNFDFDLEHCIPKTIPEAAVAELNLPRVDDSDLSQFGIKKEKAAGSKEINKVKLSSEEGDKELREKGVVGKQDEAAKPIVEDETTKISVDTKSLRRYEEPENPIVTERELEIGDNAKLVRPNWSSSKKLDVAVVILVSVMLIAVLLMPSGGYVESIRRIAPITEASMAKLDQSLETISYSALDAAEAMQNSVADNMMSVQMLIQEKMCDILGGCFA